MAQFSIPLPARDEPHRIQSTQLEGQTYTFEFNWNSRTDRWSLSIANTDGTRVLDGAILAMGIDLLRTVPGTFAHVPPGILFVGGEDEPTLETIGNHVLIYEES